MSRIFGSIGRGGRAVIVAGTVAAFAAPGASQVALASAPAAAWSKAIEVPGTAALNAGGNAGVTAISCPSDGSCAAGGAYADHAGHFRPFVVSQKWGSWGKAIEVTGPVALTSSKAAGVSAISCSLAGSCVAGGAYSAGVKEQAFIVTEKNGAWGQATEVPGLASLNAGDTAEVTQLACGLPGNCTVTGSYATSKHAQEGFAASEQNGQWSAAIEIPGTGQLNKGGSTGINSLACPSAGNCAIAGDYLDVTGQSQAFVASEKNGAWTPAIEVPGTVELNAGHDAFAGSVSCASPGNCVAGGAYLDASNRRHAFVVTETSGSWSHAVPVSGSAAFTASRNTEISAVSCASVGNCVAAGSYGGNQYLNWAFIVTQTHGVWGRAVALRGSASLNRGDNSQIAALVCRTAGNCAIGGSYLDKRHTYHAFVASERDGSWARAVEVPGITILSGPADQESGLGALSCSSAGHCAAGGSYADRQDAGQAFVVTEG